MLDKHHKKESPTFTGITRGVGGFGFGVATSDGGGGSLAEDPLFISYKSGDSSGGIEMQQNAVVLDSQENLIIAGNTNTRGHIVKLNSLGIRQWAAIIDNMNTSEGYGSGDVAVDTSDNVYYVNSTQSAGAGDWDLFLIKYNSSGVEQWQRTLGGSSYDKGYAVTTDSSDNVYVTGHTASSVSGVYYDCLIAKYNSSGTLQWQRKLEGKDTSGGYNDGAHYVVGQSITTIVASDGYPAGILVSGNFVNYDHNTSSSDDYFIARYDEDGTYRWQTYLKQQLGQEGPHAIDNFRGNKTLVTDASGNIYLTGMTGQYSGDHYPHPSYSYPREMTLVAKLSSSGSSIWARNFGDYTMHGTSIALDNSGNIYVAGTEEVYHGSSVNSGFMVKYDTNGNVLSKKYFENNSRFHYDGRYQTSADFNIWGVVTNSIGNFYLVGDSINSIQNATTSMVIFKLQTDAEFTPSNGAVTFGTSPHSFTVGELPDATPEFDAFTTDYNVKPGVNYFFSVNPNQSNLTDASTSLTSSSASLTTYDHDGWFGTGAYAGISTVSNWTYSTDYELSENIVTRSLIILLDAGNSSSYSGSGTTWTNIASPSTALGSPTFGNATIKSSYNTWTSDSGGTTGGYFTDLRASLPIPDSYLWAAYGANTMRISTFTYSIWFYPTTLSGQQVLIDQGDDCWALRTYGSALRFYTPDGSTYETTSMSDLQTNTWVNITVTHQRGSPVRIYRNGSILFTSSSSYANDKNFYYDWSFGARQVQTTAGYNGYEPFSGRIASIAIYTRELTADEILQNYNATKTKFGH